MRIHSIILKDFGHFGRKTYQLSGKFDLVYGPNFTGKTTLANAIAYALTGRPLTPIKGADLARLGQSSGTAGVRITAGEAEYEIYRSTRAQLQLRQRTASGLQIIGSSNLEAQERIDELVGGDSESLAVTSFLAEGEIATYLLSSNA